MLREQDRLDGHLGGQPLDPAVSTRGPLIVHGGATVLQPVAEVVDATIRGRGALDPCPATVIGGPTAQQAGTQGAVLGILSLIFWALIIVVTL